MGNLRQKYRLAGCPELKVHQKRSSDSGNRTNKMKRAKRSEINFLPDVAHGRTPNSLEDERKTLREEMQKKKRDWKLIDALMGSTFALQRKEIVEDEPPVSEVADRWPALLSERQIAAEFMRLGSLDLHQSFLHGLDKDSSTLLDFYRVQASSNAMLNSLLQSIDVQTSNQKRRAVELLGLPHYLREDPSNFFKVCEASDSEEEVAKGVDVGLLFMTSQADDGDMLTDILDVAVILEDKIVIHQLKTVPHAFAVLIGLLYSLNIDYPKGLKYTFEVMQKVLMDVGSAACSSKVLALKNKLLQSIV